MSDEVLVSVIIVNWNTRQLLERCLASIYAYPPQGPFEVLVVDNASNDGSSEMVRSSFPPVHLIANRENVGFAGANNQAIRASHGRYVLLLNPDTQVQPGALRILIDFLDEHPDAGAVGPRLLNADGSLQTSCYPAPTLSREFWRMFHLDHLRPYALYRQEQWAIDRHRWVDVLKGACVLLRREVLRDVGLLDESYFIYSEEVDLCLRIQRANWRLAWVPQAAVIHYGGQSTQQVAEEMFLHLYQGKILYFRKHYGNLTVYTYKLILLAAALMRLLLTPIALLEAPDRRRDHLTLSDYYRRLLVALPGM